MQVLITLQPAWSRRPQPAGAELQFPTSNSGSSSYIEGRVPPFISSSEGFVCQAYGQKFDTVLIVHWCKRQLMLRGGRHSKFEHSQTSRLFFQRFAKQQMSRNKTFKCYHMFELALDLHYMHSYAQINQVVKKQAKPCLQTRAQPSMEPR